VAPLSEKEGKRTYRIAAISGVQAADAVYKVGDSLTTKLLLRGEGGGGGARCPRRGLRRTRTARF